MEVERQSLAEAVTLAERKYSEEKKRADELQQQVKVYKSSLESSKQEFIDYKQKATRILQVSMRWLLDVKISQVGDAFRLHVDLREDLFVSGWVGSLQVPSSTERYYRRLKCPLFLLLSFLFI